MTDSSCRACGAPILWAPTRAKRGAMPLDLVPNPAGNCVIGVDGLVDVIAGPLEVEPGTTIYMPHWATCPEADKFRRRKAKEND